MGKKNFKHKSMLTAGFVSAVIIVGTGLIPIPKSNNNQNDSSPVQLVPSWNQANLSSLGQSRAVLVRPMFGNADNIRFLSDDESVAIVDEHGKVTAVNDGEATIMVEADVPGQEEPLVKELTVHVERQAQEVTAPWSWKGITAGSSSGFQSIATSGMDLVYSSSDENVATVSPDGKVTGVSPGTAIITATQVGNDNWQPASVEATVQVVGAVRDRRAALEPFFQVMEIQQQWSWDAVYGRDYGTIEGSKYGGDCTTLPTACLQRLGLLKEPGSHLPQPTRAKEHPEYFEAFTPGRTPGELVASGELIVGDIVRFKTPMQHSMIYVGWDEKRNCPLWSTSGRAGGTQGSRVALNKRLQTYEKGIIDSILRIKTYTVSASWDGPGIMDGGGEVMAKQNCTISFHPEPGAQLTSLVVDGVAVDISSGIESYTFECVLEPHSIEAKFSPVA